MACVMGGLTYWLTGLAGMEDYVCQIVTGSVVFLTRVLSVKYNICLPVLKGEQ